MPYMQSACVQFIHEQNIYDSAGALFIDCLTTVLCDTGDTCVSIVMPPPPIYALRHTAWSGILQRFLCLSSCSLLRR